MEKDRSARILALVALVIGVVGLTIGFASFSNVLDIKSTAEVKPLNTFKVVFSSSNTAQKEDSVTGSILPSDAGILATDAVIDNGASNPTISNLKATFNSPGQSVKYSFYAHNIGEYAAFLNAITFKNAASASTNKVCTAKDGTNEALVIEACKGISISVTIGGQTYTTTDTEISKPSLAIDGYTPVEVEISYANNAEVADGDFDVTFGDITLLYGSQD